MVSTAAAGPAVAGTDAEVIQASWQAPDRFGVLYDRHADVLFGYASQRVGVVAAEDLVADTFLAAFAQRHRYDLTRPDARPWLFGILGNKISRRGRAEKIHYRAFARACQAQTGEGLAERVAEQVSAQAQRGRLAAALCRLSKADRNVLLLVAWGRLSYEEVAQALDIPIGTVRSRLHRARRTVRQALAETGGPAL
jgi:RNA polymerase sigma factor (sigma-70 family)